MTNASTQFDAQEFAQFQAWKKQMAEEQAKKMLNARNKNRLMQ